MPQKPPLPPFDRAGAIQKARMAENAWNSRDPGKVALAYSEDSVWRNRAEFIRGRQEIEAFLNITVKFVGGNGYRLVLPGVRLRNRLSESDTVSVCVSGEQRRT